jgi:hypothetical protein
VLAVKTLGTILALLTVTCAFASQGVDGGLFARHATSIWAAGEVTIPSPDGTKAIVVRPPRDKGSDETHVVSVRVDGREFPTKIGEWVNAEALWAPDSTAFFVTYSDGGNIGTYHVKVFNVTKAGLRVVEPIPNGRRLFAPWCFDAEYPNVAAIRWTAHDSSRLLIAVQVPPHSSCASSGTFRAYEIAVTNSKVLRHFGQLRAKQMFSEVLGVALKDADDSCVRQPETCVPTGLKSR